MIRWFFEWPLALLTFGSPKPKTEPEPKAEIDYSQIPNSDLKWGSYGKSGKEPIKVRRLHQLDTDHLQAILETQGQLYGINPDFRMPFFPDSRYLPAIRAILRARGAYVPPHFIDWQWNLGERK